MKRLACRFAASFLPALLLLGESHSAVADFANYKSIFVDRFDYTYNSPSIPSMVAGIETIMQNAADLGFTEVVWQVRGRGDALYSSNIEPPAFGLTSGFDPLQVALDAAHARGLKVHAWLNATPMWNHATLTPPPNHIFHRTDPSFRLMDINGDLEPQAGWSNYSSVNPVLPEVHAHLNSVVHDIATNYAVDGIHLDYIRYVPGALNFNRLPHDPISHQMFNDATGLDGSNPANFAAYKNFVKNRITDLVASIKQTVDALEVSENRVMELTASVWRDPDVGENDYIQDYRTWLEQDLLDVAMPMLYLRASNDQLFNPNLLNSLNIPTNGRVAPTLGIYLHDANNGGVELTKSQMQRAYALGADGIGFYDYPAIFNDSLPANTGLAPARRAAIAEFFASIANPEPGGPGNVIDDFEIDEGHFSWPYSFSPQTTGLTEGTTIERVTDEAYRGFASQEINLVTTGGQWQYRHNSGIGAPAQPANNIPLQATGSVGFWLKTEYSGINVRIGIDDPVDGNTALEHGIPRPVISDGEWHLYQWNFEDDSQWQAFAGGANGVIDAINGTVTIDSIWFAGTGDVQIYLDDVSHNPLGSLAAEAAPGDFNGDGMVDFGDFIVWQGGFGAASGAEWGDGDADADGDVDGGDFLIWQQQVGGPSALAAGNAVPEPASSVLSCLAMVFAARKGPLGRNYREKASLKRTHWSD